MATPRDDIRYTSRRATVIANRGAVACAQPLAANIGLDILKAGGNAADAAVATAAAMALTQPTSNGMGGDAFVLYYDAKNKTVQGLNGSGRAPAALTLQKAVDDGFGPDTPFPRQHGHAVTVPGAPAAWVDTFTNFGSGKLSLTQLLMPTIELAESGFPVTQMVSGSWEASEYLLKDSRNTHGGDMLINGRAPRWGEVFKNPNLAVTLRSLAQFGKAGYYEGRIAQAIVDAVTHFEGVMTLDDLRSHTSTLDSPISTDYQGRRVWEMPPNGQGVVALLALNIVDTYDLKGLGHNTAEYMHVLIEALKLAFADGLYYVADPSKVSVPTAGMLDKSYAASRRALINPNSANLNPPRGTPPGATPPPAEVGHTPDAHSTILLEVTDSDGNACSFIQSNYAGVGTGIVPAGCGFTLQNRGANFSLEAAHPNVLAPTKRPYHTIIPAMITKADTGDLLASFGVMGGFMQPQGHLQVFLNMAVFGMDPQQALDSPRFQITSDGTNRFGQVIIEEGVPQTTIDGLRAKGHMVVFPSTGKGRIAYGRGHVITKGAWWRHEERTDTADDPSVWWAGSDPRADGQAVGY